MDVDSLIAFEVPVAVCPDHVIHCANGKLCPDSPRGGIGTLVDQAWAHTGEGGIVIHFHGGLVSHEAGIDIAHRLYPVYVQSKAFPIFLVWESGLLESIRNNAGEILAENLFGLLWKRIAGIAERKFQQQEGSRGIEALPLVPNSVLQMEIDRAINLKDGGGEPLPQPRVVDGITPLTLFEQKTLEAELAQDFELLGAIQAVSEGLLTPGEQAMGAGVRGPGLRVGSTATLMDPQALQAYIERPGLQARGFIMPWTFIAGVVKVAARVISRYHQHRDHGFHATVVEEILREFYIGNIGGLVWSKMKGDTRDCFGHDPSTHAGSALLEEIRSHLVPGQPPPRITLIGHSAGSVFIAHFLINAAKLLPGVKFDVIFEAPAILYSLMGEVLGQKDLNIRDFRMFTMKDEVEREDVLVPVLYPHSLLYFISGVLEAEADAPLVGLERYGDRRSYPASDFPTLEAVGQFIRQQKGGGVAWSIATGRPGFETDATSHGAFDDNPTLLGSLDGILQHGF